MSTNYKLVPYGVADFEQMRKENRYLVDKTIYSERMKRTGHFLFQVRPLRFGRSLFLDMTEAGAYRLWMETVEQTKTCVAGKGLRAHKEYTRVQSLT